MHNLSKKGQESRQEIINAAFDLFHERGVHATSVNDILKKSGAGKSQFYHYFKSKEDIIHELLQTVYHMIKDGHTHLKPINSWKDFRNFLDSAIEKQEEYNCSRGCPIGQISGQICSDDELLRQDIKLIFEAIKDFPKTFFIALKARNELVDNADPDTMADMCISTMQGASLIAKANKNSTALRNTSDHLYAYMRSFIK